MYNPALFKIESLTEMHALMCAHSLASLITNTADGMIATPLPMMVDTSEGEFGTLYAHLARANPQWSTPVLGEAMAIFLGQNAYVSPSWYATKAETHKVVPTWNYETVHAYGTVEFIDDAQWLHDVVTRLTDRHEAPRAERWKVSDAPDSFIAAQLKGIIGVRMQISRIEGKRKMSQNRNAADRHGVVRGLQADGQNDVAALL